MSEVEIAEVYGSLPFDGIKMSIAFFLAEFLLSATRDQHTDTNLYDFVERSLLSTTLMRFRDVRRARIRL